tara:strand:- start:1307 stop:2443 length:1137 start_codon:yes stop_codon:yes gene_type:complete
MSEIRTILYDPQSFNANRCVFTIPKGLNISASNIRVCDFKISNKSGNQIYFNHAGVYSLLSKVSVLSLAGTEIDRLSNMEMMAVRMLHMENASQFSINRQMSQGMCNSIYLNNLGQASLTERYGADDGSMMSIYWNISMMLTYLQRRVVIDEGMTILLEFAGSDVVGFEYSFVNPPSLAVDEFLTDVPKDSLEVVSYTSIIQDKLHIGQGETGFEKRLNSFYNQFLGNVYFMNILNRFDNPLINPIDKKGQSLVITIDGRQVIPLKGIDSAGKKVGFMTDFTTPYSMPGYDSALELLSGFEGFQNPNNGMDYANNFSYGCFLLNRYIGNDLTISYNFDTSAAVASPQGETLLILSEVMRSYDRANDKVSFVGSVGVPA